MLYTPARAAELNLLRKRADWAAISAVVTTSAGSFDGASLRRELTKALGGEPPKPEVLTAIASAVHAGRRIAVSPTSPDSEVAPTPLSAGEIEGAELDALFVFVPEQSIDPPLPPLRRIVVEGETTGSALRNLRDAVADAGVDEIVALTLTASAAPGQGVANLRALGYCAYQLPRFECEITASLQIEFGGLDGAVDTELAGRITDWRPIEQAMFELVDLGSKVGGTLTMRLTPPSPVAVEGSDWEQFRSVVANNNPGALRIETEPADGAPSGGER